MNWYLKLYDQIHYPRFVVFFSPSHRMVQLYFKMTLGAFSHSPANSWPPYYISCKAT